MGVVNHKENMAGSLGWGLYTAGHLPARGRGRQRKKQKEVLELVEVPSPSVPLLPQCLVVVQKY